MYQTLLKNKWVALAVVVLVLAGIQMLIGRSGDDGVIPRAQAEIADRHPEAAGASDNVVTPAPVADDDADASADDTQEAYVDDDELIDDAAGYDPSPSDDGPQADDSGPSDGGPSNGGGDVTSDDSPGD